MRSHKDFGIMFDNSLKFHDLAIEVTGNANDLLGLIRKSFGNRYVGETICDDAYGKVYIGIW